MYEQILEKLRLTSDGLTSINSFRDYLSSKLAKTVDLLNWTTDLIVMAFTDEQTALGMVNQKFPNNYNIMMETYNEATDAKELIFVKVRDYAIACITAQHNVVDAFDAAKQHSVTKVTSLITAQVTAAKLAIEMLKTFADNAIGAFVDGSANLLQDYAARVQLSVGVMNDSMISSCQQFVSLLSRTDSPLRDKIIMILDFFGFTEAADEDFDGFSKSDFTDITGVAPIGALVQSVSNTLGGVVGDVLSTIGVATKNVLLAIVGTLWRAGTDIVYTLSGKHDSYSKDFLSFNRDLTVTDFGPVCTYPFRGQGTYPAIWNTLPYYDEDVWLRNAYVAVYTATRGGAVPSSIPNVDNEGLLLATMQLYDELNPPITSANMIASYHIDVTDFYQMLALMIFILVRKHPGSYTQFVSKAASTAITDWMYKGHSMPPGTRADGGDLYNKLRLTELIAYSDMVSAVLEGAKKGALFFNSAVYEKVPDKAYLKIRLIGAYLYIYKRASSIWIKFQWIPINPFYLSPVGATIKTYSDTGGAMHVYDCNQNATLSLPPNDQIAQFVDSDFGDPNDDYAFYSWVSNAKVLTLMQLISMSNDAYVNGMPANLVFNAYNSISKVTYSYNTMLFGGCYISDADVSSAVLTNRLLAEDLTGYTPDVDPTAYKPAHDSIRMAIERFIDSISQPSIDKERDYIPYYITIDIKRGSYHVRTDTGNAMRVGAAIAGLLVAGAAIVSQLMIRKLKRATYIAQGKADVQAFVSADTANLQAAYILQKKANLLDMITSALSSTVASAGSATTSSLMSATMAAAAAQADSAIASEMNINSNVTSSTSSTEQAIIQHMDMLIVGTPSNTP